MRDWYRCFMRFLNRVMQFIVHSKWQKYFSSMQRDTIILLRSLTDSSYTHIYIHPMFDVISIPFLITKWSEKALALSCDIANDDQQISKLLSKKSFTHALIVVKRLGMQSTITNKIFAQSLRISLFQNQQLLILNTESRLDHQLHLRQLIKIPP